MLAGFLDNFSASKRRVPCLDGLRAVSVLMVLIQHFVFGKAQLGALGVQIFFVISGFLITRLLFAEAKVDGAISPIAFYIRRILRLYPTIVVFMIICTAVVVVVGHSVIDPAESLSVLLYFYNYLCYYREIHHVHMVSDLWPYGPLWSLSVEEQFYLAFPLVFVALRFVPRRLAIAACIACVLSLILRLWVARNHPEFVNTTLIRQRTDLRMDGIGAGVLLACICEMRMGWTIVTILSRPAVLATMCIAALVVFLFCGGFVRETFGYSVQAAFAVALICSTSLTGKFRTLTAFLETPRAIYFGKISYALYVWQAAAAGIAYNWLGLWHTSLGAAVALVLTFPLAIASYHLVEQPVANLRRIASRWKAFATSPTLSDQTAQRFPKELGDS